MLIEFDPDRIAAAAPHTLKFDRARLQCAKGVKA
jgi:hypothetical protein